MSQEEGNPFISGFLIPFFFSFSTIISKMEDTVKQDLNALIKKYDTFIANTLKPSLKKELDERDLVFNHISE